MSNIIVTILNTCYNIDMEMKDTIKFLRKDANFTQAQLAEKLNVGQATVCQWESGKCFPTAQMLKAMSEFFGISADFILGISDKKEGDSGLNEEVEECIVLFDNLTSYQRGIIKELMKQMKPF